MASNILVVDDHFALREGLRLTLLSLFPGATVHQAASLAQARQALAADPGIELVLLDLNLADSSGADTLRELKAEAEWLGRQARILVVSAAADYDAQAVAQVIEDCAVGYIPKNASEAVLKQGIDMALAGCVFVPDIYLRQRIREADESAVSQCWQVLSERERQIAELLIQGQTYKQVARRLEGASGPLSDNTIRVHAQRMAWKLRMQLDDPGLEKLPAKAVVMMALGRQPRPLAQVN